MYTNFEKVVYTIFKTGVWTQTDLNVTTYLAIFTIWTLDIAMSISVFSIRNAGGLAVS